METKPRILYLLKILDEQTDEDHPLSTKQLNRQGFKRIMAFLLTEQALYNLHTLFYNLQITHKKSLFTESWGINIEREHKMPRKSC